MSKTVKQLAEEVAALQAATPDTHVSSFFVWHWEQVAAVLEEYDRYGEMIKCEITHGFEPGRRPYGVIVWHRHLLNAEARAKLKKKGYYAGLEASKEELS